MSEAPLINRGGRSVPPREVERVLLGHPAVAEVAVVGVPDGFLDEIVAAAVRLSTPLPSAAVDLTGYCLARLAPYKVPARWLFTRALPRTQAGEPRRPAITAQLALVAPLDQYRPGLAGEDLGIPEQVRRSWAPDDLDNL